MEINKHKEAYDANISAICLNRYKFSIGISGFIAFLGIFLGCIEQELYLKKKENDEIRFQLLIANLVVTLALIISITFDYLLWIRYKMKGGDYLIGTTIRSSDLLPYYGLELFISIVTPYPWLYKTGFNERLTDKVMPIYLNTEFFTFMVMFRSYHFARYGIGNTDFMSPRAARIHQMFGSSISLNYAIKGEFEASSFKVIGFTFVYGVTMLAFCLRGSELQSFVYANHGDFHYFGSLWNIIVTMTTVGYGELSPKSGNGRFVAVVGAFNGTFLTSLMVISFHK